MRQLQDYLGRSEKLYPDKVACVVSGKRFTYQSLDTLTTKMAQALLQNGLVRGGRVVAMMGNCIETIITFWAVLKAGGVISIISDDLKADKIEYIKKDSGCQFFMTMDLFKSLAVDESIILKPYKNIDIDLAAIVYTSGSTGEPKGVMLTHSNMIAALESINAYLGNTHQEVILSALPLSFDYGLYQMIMAISVGGCLILEKDLLLPLQFLKKISVEKVTALPGVPTLFSILGETFKKFPVDTSSVRYITNTGAAIYDHHLDAIRTLFQTAQFFSMYGLTECKRCTYLPPEDLDRKRGSVGIAIPNTEIYIVDDDGLKLGANQVGQLVVRGTTVMKGYWNHPEETAIKLIKGDLPGEQVLMTGDYGYIDNEGYFYFKGRMDESIKSRGIKVIPKEIEEVINNIDGVREAAVVGVEDAVLGISIVAYVACYPSIVMDEATIHHACKLKLEKEKCPHSIKFLPDLPKSANGKINKKYLIAGANA